MPIRLIRKIVFVGVAVCSLVGMLITACAPGILAQGRSGASETLFDMPARSFFAMERLDQPIIERQIDQELLSAALFHETNRRRLKHGLSPLQHDSRLDAAAHLQADDMARYRYLSHTNAHHTDQRTPGDRALRAGFKYRFLAENVATHFAIQYEGGKAVYVLRAGMGFSYRPNGQPIPRQTYRSFASTLLDQWMDSPGHRANILSREPERFGSDCRLRREKNGMDTFYCVQVFGSPEAR